jgi:hypothetical protein
MHPCAASSGDRADDSKLGLIKRRNGHRLRGWDAAKRDERGKGNELLHLVSSKFVNRFVNRPGRLKRRARRQSQD